MPGAPAPRVLPRGSSCASFFLRGCHCQSSAPAGSPAGESKSTSPSCLSSVGNSHGQRRSAVSGELGFLGNEAYNFSRTQQPESDRSLRAILLTVGTAQRPQGCCLCKTLAQPLANIRESTKPKNRTESSARQTHPVYPLSPPCGAASPKALPRRSPRTLLPS